MMGRQQCVRDVASSRLVFYFEEKMTFSLLVVVTPLVKAEIKAAVIAVASNIAAKTEKKIHNREHGQ